MPAKDFKHKLVPKIILRDRKGRFVPAVKRFKKGLVKTVQVWRRHKGRKKLITVLDEGEVTPTTLAQVLRRHEYESFPETFVKLASVKPDRRRRSRVMDAANKIDAMKGVKNKLLRVKVTGKFGKKVRRRSFYIVLKRDTWNGYRLYARIHGAFKQEVPFEYDELEEISESQDEFDLSSVEVEEVI